MVKLSSRLAMIAGQVPQDSRIADIGSDHALLPTYLVQRGIATFAVAGEVNQGPFEAATKQVAQANLADVVSVRRGDGLAVIHPGEVDVITIAGMGGSLIVKILSAGESKLPGVKRLVLQPNVGEDQVRTWLLERGWVLVEEQILEEDDKIYEILTAERMANAEERNAALYPDTIRLSCGISITRERLIAMGPYLLKQADPVLFAKWELEIGKLERIVGTLRQSNLEASREKEDQLRQEIACIKEVLQCLQKDKP